MYDILHLTDIFAQNMLISCDHWCALWTLSVLRIKLSKAWNMMFMKDNDEFYIP